MTAMSGKKENHMTTFTINEQNEIVVFASREAAAATTATPFDSFSSRAELAELAAGWPAERLVAIWNSLPGVKPIKKFKQPKTAISQVWDRIQGLGDNASPKAEKPQPKAKAKAKAGARAAQGAPSKAKAPKKTTAAKAAPRGKKGAKALVADAPREGSKTAQVLAMLQRKNGATITEIMETMGWQRHTVRGFMAGALKKAGYTVESFKPEGGERSYRLPRPK